MVMQDPKLMDMHLLEYCKLHFGQVHGTPYTVPLLSTLLRYDGLTPFGNKILTGTANLEELQISNYTRMLLKHQKLCTPTDVPRYQEMPYEKLMQGFRQWKEWTSTSPSGRHLAIYKSLLKDHHWQQSKNNQQHRQQSTSSYTSAETSAPKSVNGVDVMQLIHKMLVLMVCHCHTYDRWAKIWNFFIKKDLGHPNINHLRTIHLIEANLNLLFKWFGPQGVLKCAKTYDQLTDNQGGNHKGQSAIDMACKKVCTFKLI